MQRDGKKIHPRISDYIFMLTNRSCYLTKCYNVRQWWLEHALI